MIEDSLGLRIYQFKRTESERRLAKTLENMKEAEMLRREIAPHLKFLKKQVERVNEGRELREQLIGLYREYLKREEVYVQERIRMASERKALPMNELQSIDKEIAEKRTFIANERGSDVQAQAILEVESKLRSARNRKEEISRHIGRVEGMIEFEDKRLKKKSDALSRVEEVKVDLREIQELSNTIERELEVYEHGSDLSELHVALLRVRTAVRDFLNFHRSQHGPRELSADDYLEIHHLREEKSTRENELTEVMQVLEVLDGEYVSMRSNLESEKERSHDAERELFTLMSKRSSLQAQVDRSLAEEANLGRERRNLEEELTEAGILLGRSVLDFSAVIIDTQEIMDESRDRQEDRRRKIERGKIRLEDIGAQGGEELVREYEETKERDAFLGREMEDLVKTADQLRDLILELNGKIETEFKSGVKKINKEFGKFFVMMFGGGVAELRIVAIEKRKKKDELAVALSDTSRDTAPEDEEGIDVHIALPHKKIRGLQMLSGGERALTSIALVFAVSQVNPPPFMVLDETDAALDEANSRRYGDMIESLATCSQLVVVTHNRETMSRASVLYGVTMGADAASKLLSIEFDEAVKVAK